jgi:hypothetical protein
MYDPITPLRSSERGEGRAAAVLPKNTKTCSIKIIVI